MNRFIYFIILGIVALIPNSAYSQRRMMNTKSSSEILKMTNPNVINSVGKIEGREIDRAQASSNQQQTEQQNYIEDEFYNSEYEFPDEAASRASNGDENNPDKGFTRF